MSIALRSHPPTHGTTCLKTPSHRLQHLNNLRSQSVTSSARAAVDASDPEIFVRPYLFEI